MKSIKDLLQSLYSFFFHNPKRHIEFLKLAKLMKKKERKFVEYHNTLDQHA